MLKKIRIALAQINPIVGDLQGNVKKIISYIKNARALKAEIIAFPELAVTGYPPEDLVLKPQFIKDNIDALNEVITASDGITAIVGFIERDNSLFNAAAVISNRRLIDVYHKKHLPNYGVFDEYRYFQSGIRYPVYNFSGVNIGVNICEDIWHEKGPAKVQALSGAEIIININASPYHMGKASFRDNLVSTRALECKSIIVYVNMIGGQDELVFDGGSFVVNSQGDIILRGGQFKEELITVDIKVQNARARFSDKEEKELKTLVHKGEVIENIKIPSKLIKERKPELKIKESVIMPPMEEVYNALLLGTKDYVYKNGFKNVVIGMSGGVDSSLVAAVAVDAIGKEHVHGLFMPSPYTSKESYEDVYALAGNIGIKIVTIPINSIYKTYLKTLSKNFKGTKTDITEENIQARIRGNVLMAFSNKFGWLVLTTGTKSEMSVGY
ncbi:MAG: NAD+ synthase, partial [Nitrospirae bacterium]|nr:NAD+ synthase [Nitrospirota bacterium]